MPINHLADSKIITTFSFFIIFLTDCFIYKLINTLYMSKIRKVQTRLRKGWLSGTRQVDARQPTASPEASQQSKTNMDGEGIEWQEQRLVVQYLKNVIG